MVAAGGGGGGGPASCAELRAATPKEPIISVTTSVSRGKRVKGGPPADTPARAACSCTWTFTCSAMSGFATNGGTVSRRCGRRAWRCETTGATDTPPTVVPEPLGLRSVSAASSVLRVGRDHSGCTVPEHRNCWNLSQACISHQLTLSVPIRNVRIAETRRGRTRECLARLYLRAPIPTSKNRAQVRSRLFGVDERFASGTPG